MLDIDKLMENQNEHAHNLFRKAKSDVQVSRNVCDMCG